MEAIFFINFYILLTYTGALLLVQVLIETYCVCKFGFTHISCISNKFFVYPGMVNS